MSIRINNIILRIDEDRDILIKKIAKKLKVSEEEVQNFKIIKESLDARKKNDIKYLYCVEVEHKNEKK
ncbi:oxidoreductase, FAD-binding protein [Clostridium sartagoforme AAU1]|uniref:Oxidoreductase, FAD-binding protein n=2 Tax=Clostridium sartagoforme TaxID=84031 RepID=R9CF91_9CLOT|nr:oxidoreductase, FAD-binding protein [Clostridium sartagoforme AAU1]